MAPMSRLVAVWALLAQALAVPLDSSPLGALSLKELIDIPKMWTELGPASPTTPLLVQIALKQSNIAGLERKLLDISDPTSPNYGEWLSISEIQSYTTPAASTTSAVKQWLTSSGFEASAIKQPQPDFIEVQMPVSQAELLLGTTYSLFSHPDVKTPVPRALQYSVPADLIGLIDTIQPTTAFYVPIAPKLKDNSTTAAAAPAAKRATTCDPNNITPACLNSYYGVDYTSKGKAPLGVTGFIDYGASHTDAAQFFKMYAPAVKGFADGSISGGSNSGTATLEGNLDSQFAAALGYPNPTTFYEVGPDNNDFTDQVSNFANYLNTASSPPTSVSTSYGGEEQGFSSSYLTRTCTEFMKAGARGVSIFFSSGDYGVGGNGESSCSNGYYALWPASCPYITAVGATEFTSAGGEATAMFENGGSSGGGFSNVFSAPSYQSADTAAYIKKNLGSSYNGYYNPQGRGYPDVALVGEYYDVIMGGSVEQVYGTSCSSPSWAAFVSLLNDYRISEGKPVLGFLNPLLYGNASAGLNDITTGHNQGCNTYGYPAAAGWDPTTGLGSINFPKLMKLVS